MTTKLNDLAINEFRSLIEAKKTIVPFAKNRFSCNSVNANENVVHVDLFQYDDIEEYCAEDRTISVQCGIKVKQLQEFLASKKQWLPVSYADMETSLLDLILTDDAVILEAVFGGLRRHVLGLTFILADGDLAKSGGKVVKNVSGYDLPRFLIGSYGHFAIPIKANLRIYSLPKSTATLLVQGKNFDQLLTAASRILIKGIMPTYVNIIGQNAPPVELGDEHGKPYLNVVNGAPNFTLILGFCGDQEHVSTASVTAGKIFTQAELYTVTVTDLTQQENLLRQLARITSYKNSAVDRIVSTIDVLLNEQDCCKLLQTEELGSFSCVYSPISHRLRYCLSSDTEKEKVLNLLTKYSQKNSAPLTVAYGDDNYIRIVSKLGCNTENSDKAMSDIKQRLKIALDPDNLFNPFVKL